MASLAARGPAPADRLLLLPLAAFAAMYLPVYWWAASTIWESEEHGHGPIILAVAVWLFWHARDRFLALAAPPRAALGAHALVLFGVALYLAGSALDFTILRIGSQIPLLAGLIAVARGWAGVRALWFPLLYLVFMIPLPGVLIDAATGTLKQWVSVIAEQLLFHAGYPIGRTGVMLTVGQYQLLVADACSGLNSMFSLSALGLLFMHVVKRPSRLHNAIMLASVLPIAFVANIIRVMVLVLVTYHLGDEAGQGFLHGAAGIVLLLVALATFVVLDAVLGRVIRSPQRA